MKPLVLAANMGFAGLNTSAWLRYRRALRHPRRVQSAMLRRYLARNAETVFGREHGFASIRSIEEYRARVPVRDYDQNEHYIARIVAGERGVLTREEVEVLEWSSGSTRAAKLIPFTRSLRSEFARSVGSWVTEIFARDPKLMSGPAYWSVSPAHAPPEVPGAAVPIGPLEDAQYLGGRLARLIDVTLAVPGSVSRIRDPELHRRATLLHLLASRELTLISVWHPSFLTLLVEALLRDWDALLSALTEGSGRSEGPLRFEPRAARARELSRIDPSDPKAIWPRLALISCWTHGPARRPAEELRALFPGVRIQGKGLLATEGIVSLPFGYSHPLALTSHFFEFVDGNDRARAAWELEEGEEYSVVLTTGGGLYRYALHDRVRVTGFLHDTPCLAFLGKDDHLSDLCGEKLSQGFVQAVVDRVLRAHGVSADFAMLAPEEGSPRPRYVLYLTARDQLPESLERELEGGLRANPHYAHCAALGQLGRAGVVPVAGDAPHRYMEHLAASGQRIGDIKPVALSPMTEWGRIFRPSPFDPAQPSRRGPGG